MPAASAGRPAWRAEFDSRRELDALRARLRELVVALRRKAARESAKFQEFGGLPAPDPQLAAASEGISNNLYPAVGLVNLPWNWHVQRSPPNYAQIRGIGIDQDTSTHRTVAWFSRAPQRPPPPPRPISTGASAP